MKIHRLIHLWAIDTVYFCVQTETQRWKLKSPRGVVGELWDFKHFTLPRVLECKPIPGITIKRERTCIWRSCVKKALLMKTEWRKDKVQRGNPLFKCQAVGAILSPALISSFLLPSWLRFLTFVSPSWPFACLCRWVWLNTCQVATDIHHPWFGEVVHTCVTPQEGKDARWRKSKFWHNCEFNPSEICFNTWVGLCDFPARVWLFKSQPACFLVCRFPLGSCTVILFLLFLSSFCTKPVCYWIWRYEINLFLVVSTCKINQTETPLAWSKLYSHLVVEWGNACLNLVVLAVILFSLQ